MATQPGTELTRALILTRLFIEALDARDLDALMTVVDENVEFRNRAEGRALHGREGLERIVAAAATARVWMIRQGKESISSAAGAIEVSVPVLELVGGRELDGTASFEIRDGALTAFSVSSELLRS